MATTTVHHPSPQLPGLPRFSLDVPTDWRVGERPGALVVAGSPDASAPFRANVTVAAERVATDLPVTELADQFLASVGAEHGPVEVEHRATGTGDDGEVLLTQVLNVTAGEGVAVSQLHVLILEPPSASGLRTAFSIIGSCATVDRRRLGPILRAVIGSFTLRRPSGLAPADPRLPPIDDRRSRRSSPNPNPINNGRRPHG